MLGQKFRCFANKLSPKIFDFRFVASSGRMPACHFQESPSSAHLDSLLHELGSLLLDGDSLIGHDFAQLRREEDIAAQTETSALDEGQPRVLQSDVVSLLEVVLNSHFSVLVRESAINQSVS